MRGHQLGYRDKQNTCPAWTEIEYQRYIRALLIFGSNSIELLPPRTDDNLFSGHFKRDPFELMEEIEQVLGIRSCPVNWPIGIHGDFKGVYHRDTRMIELYRGGDHGQTQVEVREVSLDDPECASVIGQSYYDKLIEDIELLDVAGDLFLL